MLKPRQKLIKEVRLLLGEPTILNELTGDHFELAIDIALDRYRLRSSNSVEERIAFLDLQRDQNIYFLPDEIVEVRQIFRSGAMGTVTGTGAYFEPFAASFANQFIINGNGSSGDLVTYELFTGFEKLVANMFGAYLLFFWSPTEHRLEIQRNILAQETVALWVYNHRPEDRLLEDIFAKTWLRDYTLAKCKDMMGEMRGKFSSMPGPGGMQLNGPALKAEALAEMLRLEDEIIKNLDSNIGYGFVIG